MMLTARQQDAIERICAAHRDYQQQHGFPPSLREWAKASGYSVTGLGYYLPLAAAAGLITVEPRQARGIRVLDRDGAA